MSDEKRKPDAKDGFPDYRESVGMKYVYLGYTTFMKHSLTLVLVPVAAVLSLKLASMHQEGKLLELWDMARSTDLALNLVTAVAMLVCLAVVGALFFTRRSTPVYLLDFAAFKPYDDTLQSDHEEFRMCTRRCGKFSQTAIDFQERILDRAGLGQQTYLPHALRTDPPVMSHANAMMEAELVMYGAVAECLAKTKWQPKDIDILVVNCSLLNPTPSLSAMIINHFKLKTSIISYNLAGMGCSAGVIAVDLARQLLQVYPNSNALVVSTENITQNWYFGNNRSMLIPNCIFRMGASCVALTNRRSAWWTAKYQLLHVVRTMTGADDRAFHCISQQPDDTGMMGIKLSKELLAAAGKALKYNITTLGPLVLPISEQLLFFVNLIGRKLGGRNVKPYIPNFKLAFDHFCVHTGGRAVIEEIEKQLELTPAQIRPSKQTLYRYGNTSSSSLWYVLAFTESVTGVRRNDRVWQIGFGSGFKCNSAVWRALRPVKDQHRAWTKPDGSLDVHEGPYSVVE